MSQLANWDKLKRAYGPITFPVAPPLPGIEEIKLRIALRALKPVLKRSEYLRIRSKLRARYAAK